MTIFVCVSLLSYFLIIFMSLQYTYIYCYYHYHFPLSYFLIIFMSLQYTYIYCYYHYHHYFCDMSSGRHHFLLNRMRKLICFYFDNDGVHVMMGHSPPYYAWIFVQKKPTCNMAMRIPEYI